MGNANLYRPCVSFTLGPLIEIDLVERHHATALYSMYISAISEAEKISIIESFFDVDVEIIDDVEET